MDDAPQLSPRVLCFVDWARKVQMTSAPNMADAAVAAPDGVRIHYLVGGDDEPGLVFVHGWLGNAHWWDEQLAHFAPRHRVAAIDLAGHGGSGCDRVDWSVDAFAADVVAVVEALGLQRVVLVGHSMSGKIVVEAARRLPGRVVAIVPVDTLGRPQEATTLDHEKERVLAGMRNDFVTNAPALLAPLFAKSSPPAVVERVLREARSSPPDISVAMLESAWRTPSVPGLRASSVPIRAINAAPTDVAANRVFAPRFDLVPMPGVGHWPMLEAPERFDALLEQVLDEVVRT